MNAGFAEHRAIINQGLNPGFAVSSGVGSLRQLFFSCCLHKLRIARNMLHNRQIQSFSRLVWLAVFASCLHMKRTTVSKNSNIKFLRCCFRPFDSLSFSVSPPLFVTFPLVTPFWLISMIQICVSRLLSLILFLPLFHPALFLSPFLSLPPLLIFAARILFIHSPTLTISHARALIIEY